MPLSGVGGGGPEVGSLSDVLSVVEQAIAAGGSGVCMGRQVFASDNPAASVRALRAVVHDGLSAAEAAALLG